MLGDLLVTRHLYSLHDKKEASSALREVQQLGSFRAWNQAKEVNGGEALTAATPLCNPAPIRQTAIISFSSAFDEKQMVERQILEGGVQI
jgi:hypothetical protein